MLNEPFRINFSSDNPEQLFTAVATAEPFCSSIPRFIEIDYENVPVEDTWIDTVVTKSKKQAEIRWGEDSGLRIGYFPGVIVEIVIPADPDIESLVAWLSSFDFTLASFNTLHTQWLDIDEEYVAPIMGPRHHPHGWACAVKGVGLDHLVSRRWLDYGPWKCFQGNDTTTLLQFHDLQTNAATSLEQAKKAHDCFGPSDNGGFLEDNYFFDYDLKGSYSADEKMLRIVVHGRDITSKEMLDMCAARRMNMLGPDKKIRRIACIFMEEQQARSHLHDLWLHGLECWALIEGVEVQLDADYHPEIEKPDWTK